VRNGVVDPVAVTGQLLGDLRDGAAPSDLACRPLRRCRGGQALLRRDGTQLFFAQLGFTQPSRCFFQAPDMGVP
jgi:hypothetical protein